MEGPQYTTEEQYKIILDGIKNPPTTKQELYKFVYCLTGQEPIPFQNVCEDHQSPFDFLWKAYRIDLPEWKSKTNKNLLVIGPRGGYKTLTLAKLIITEMLLKPHAGTLALGAVEKQANRCFGYASKYMQHPLIAQLGIVTKFLTAYMSLANGSSYEQVIATIAGTNSAHQPKLRIDEVDLISEDILSEAMMQASSFAGVAAHTIYISTRKSLDGTMHQLMKNAEAQRTDVIVYCYKETSEQCPDSRSGVQEKVYEVEDMYNPGETIIVNARAGCEQCPLLPSCRGDLKRSRGLTPIEDTIDEFIKLPREKWIAQKECREPRRGNLFFDEWSSKIQLGDYPYNPDLVTDMCFDFTNGGNSPTTCDIMQEDASGNNYLVAALEYAHMSTNLMGDAIYDFCQKMNIKNIRMQIGDSAQMQMIRDLNSHRPDFFRIMPCKKIARSEGWPLVRKLVRGNDGRRKLFIDRTHGKLAALEMEHAKTSKSDPNDVSKLSRAHHLDAIRYREVKLRYMEGGEPRMRLLTPPGSDETGKTILPPSSGSPSDFFNNLFRLDNDND